jgi:uncharacterized lipoprotein YajG
MKKVIFVLATIAMLASCTTPANDSAAQSADSTTVDSVAVDTSAVK